MSEGGDVPMEYHYGSRWDHKRGTLIKGSADHEAPWSPEFAELVFSGQTELTFMTILSGPLGAPTAHLAVDCTSRGGAAVTFLDELGRECLEFVFRAPLPDGVLVVEDGVFRDHDLFLSHALRRRFTGELDQYGSPKSLELLARKFSNDGRTRVNVMMRDRSLLGADYVDPTMDWWDDPDVDVSADGFWEPAPTWGDWDRWFVRDRPGVKLFD